MEHGGSGRCAPVTIWVISRPCDETVAWSWCAIDAVERDRADRIRDPESRDRFLVTRGALRDILGQAIERPASEVPLRPGVHGEVLVGATVGTAPRFSVSHTLDLSLIAIHPTVPVGVDAEHVHGPVDPDVAARYCTRRERRWLERRDGPERNHAFMRLWVRKEAVAKADGRGLLVDPARLDVLRPGPVAVPAPAPAGPLEVSDLPLPSPVVGALAAPRAHHRPVWRAWSPWGTEPWFGHA